MNNEAGQNEDDEEESEMFELNSPKDETNGTDSVQGIEEDQWLTRLIRSIFHRCVPFIDSCLSPKLFAIILLLIFIPNTCLLAIMVIYISNGSHPLHIVTIVISIVINVIIAFTFCLIRPKTHTDACLFKCPGVPLIPLVNINIFIFLMVFQDISDWLGYTCIIGASLLIYCSYSYWHSKAR